MSDPDQNNVDAEHRNRLLATLELAFATDPVMRWFWPDPLTYRSAFPSFVLAVAREAFTVGMALSTDDRRGVALWLPPGHASDDDEITTVILESVEELLLEDLSGFADQIRGYHPEFDHWYLPMIGVDPALQGRGYGSRLLDDALAICDRDSLPAYLESSSPRSRALYLRHGFEEIGVVQFGSSPTVTAMVREPIPGGTKGS